MITLFVLLGGFSVFVLIDRLRFSRWNFAGPARLAMALLLCFTGVSHFFLTEGMASMLPEFVPFREALVYLTGAAEIALGIAMAVPARFVATLPDWRRRVGFVAALFIAALTPANIYAALQSVDFGGHSAGPAYLWFRIPLQLLFLLWIYFAFIRADAPEPSYD